MSQKDTLVANKLTSTRTSPLPAARIGSLHCAYVQAAGGVTLCKGDERRALAAFPTLSPAGGLSEMVTSQFTIEP